jgi:hypothetical protein
LLGLNWFSELLAALLPRPLAMAQTLVDIAFPIRQFRAAMGGLFSVLRARRRTDAVHGNRSRRSRATLDGTVPSPKRLV